MALAARSANRSAARPSLTVELIVQCDDVVATSPTWRIGLVRHATPFVRVQGRRARRFRGIGAEWSWSESPVVSPL